MIALKIKDAILAARLLKKLAYLKSVKKAKINCKVGKEKETVEV